MNDDSLFAPQSGLEHPDQVGGIDFTQAKLRFTHGFTCDGYDARYCGTRVFVKRLKPEHRGRPSIRIAFEKELEIGLSLSHRSLPGYMFAGEDYIVMHYVDGHTLGQLIASHDPLLSNETELRRILTELVDVVDYLHQHHVVHCDIKPDNVMITCGTRNVVLIDLGEAYTDWLDRSSGDMTRFGLDDADRAAHPAADFRGIGMILDRLTAAGYPTGRFSRFRKLCDDIDITPRELRRSLRPARRMIYILSAITAAAVVAVVAIIAQRPKTQTVAPAAALRDTIVVVNEPPKPEAVGETLPPKPQPPTYKDVIKKGAGNYFKPTRRLLEEAEAMLADPSATTDQIRDLMMQLAVQLATDTRTGCQMYESTYGTVSPVEIQMTFVETEAYRQISAKVENTVKRMLGKIDTDVSPQDTI